MLDAMELMLSSSRGRRETVREHMMHYLRGSSRTVYAQFISSDHRDMASGAGRQMQIRGAALVHSRWLYSGPLRPLG